MTYYRNYKDKDKVLIRHLRESFQKLEAELWEAEEMSERNLWERFFITFRNDPAVVKTVKAGLIDSLIEIHSDFTIRVFRRIFHLDMSNEKNLMMAYQRMGSVVGFMLHLIRHNQNADVSELAKEVVSEPNEERGK